MPSSRKKGKTYKGAWLEDKRIEQLKNICSSLGVDFTTFLKNVSDGDLVLIRKEEKKGDQQ